MIELGKHISYLLLDHRCVIVPGLGGFVTQYASARYVKSEHIIQPPYRRIGFNPQLTLNDGLLVQSYMRLYETNYPEAMKMIAQAVAEMKNELQQTSQCQLSGIGCLRYAMNGSISFEPYKAGILAPELYGLGSLAIQPQHRHLNAEEAELQDESTETKQRSRVYTLRINREIVNYVAASIVSIFFYFLWAAPVGDGNLAAGKGEATFAASLPMAVEVAAKPDIAPVEVAQPTPVKEGFTIVLASSIPLKNAETFVSELHKKGMTDAAIMVKGKMTRVVYGTYADENEAYTVVRKLHHDENFSQAWVMPLK